MGTPKITFEGDKSRSPWDFTQPIYDHRHSNFINAGTHRGVGKNQPVGHFGNPLERVPCLPFGRPKQMKVDEKG